MSDDDDNSARRRREEALAKLRQQQAKEKERGRDNNTRGEQFHRGMAQIREETREQGWVREHREDLPSGKYVKLDQARVLGGEKEFSEYKSGRIDGKAREQLAGHRYLLEKGIYKSGQWVTVRGEPVPAEIRDLIRDMKRDFPGRFAHIEVSREMAARAIDLGKSLMPGQQRELPGVGDKARAYQLAQELMQQRARERGERFKAMEQFRGQAARGRGDATQRRQQERQQAERARAEREAAERVAREFTPPSQQPRGREATDPTEHAAREALEARERAERAAQQARDLAAQWQLAQIREFQRKGMSPELIRIMEFIHKGMPAPGVPLPGAPELAHEVMRGGRAAERDRIRNLGLEKGGR